MVRFEFRGLMAPVFTPFKRNSAKDLNLDLIPNYAKHLKRSGITAILVNGTTGEGMSMSCAERCEVADAWMKVCKEEQMTCMIQIGGAPLPDVLKMAQHAQKIKADAVLCLPELYSKPTTAKELIKYLEVISDAAPNIPLLYYHIPELTKVNINMEELLNQIDNDRTPNFCGIKFTSNNLKEGYDCIKARNGKYAIFLGADQIAYGAVALGFDSAISTSLNMLAKHSIEIFKPLKTPECFSKKQTEQDKLNAAIKIITKNGSWVSTMKEAMRILTGIDLGPVRSPLVSLNETEINEMRASLTAA